MHTYNYYRTRGDGNCLYRACSKLLCGKEDLCHFLRSLTSIELFSNQKFYAFHPYVLESTHIFQCENTAFSATVSDSALGDGYDGKDPSSRKLVVQREAIRNAKSGTQASFLCLLALSSVTGMSVCSVYQGKVGKESIYSKFLNGTVLPRLSHNHVKDKLVQGCNLVLMWTTHGIVSIPGMSENFQPNHFVPLVDFVANDSSQKKAKQRKITDMFKVRSVQQQNIVSEGIYFKHM